MIIAISVNNRAVTQGTGSSAEWSPLYVRDVYPTLSSVIINFANGILLSWCCFVALPASTCFTSVGLETRRMSLFLLRNYP